MACRDGFGNPAWKVIFFYGAGVNLVKTWADFFWGKFSDFWSLLEILSVVFNFLLSSPTVLCEDSDFQSESFQKICGEKFELPPGLTHGDEISEFS